MQKSYFSPGSYDEECAWFGAESNNPKTTESQSSAFPEAGLFTLKNTDIFVLVSLNAYKYRQDTWTSYILIFGIKVRIFSVILAHILTQVIWERFLVALMLIILSK